MNFADEFAEEFATMGSEVRIEIAARVVLLERFGPALGRPHADTLKGSAYGNMKEVRFDASGGVWRVAFAFDPDRSGILLVAASKVGVSKERFYRRLIETADKRFRRHLADLEQGSDRHGRCSLRSH